MAAWFKRMAVNPICRHDEKKVKTGRFEKERKKESFSFDFGLQDSGTISEK